MRNKLDTAIAQLVDLVKNDGPPLLKAHCIINVLFPKVVAAAGCVEEVGHALGASMAARMCEYLGMCQMCKKQHVSGPSEMFCAKCGAEADQWVAEAMKE